MPTEEQLQEIHRLAVLGDAAAIAQAVGTRLAGSWLRVSRFREVRDVSLKTLALGPHAWTLNHLARAQHILGEVQEALTRYGEALKIEEAVGDQAGLAATLSNIGLVYHGLGQLQAALTYYQQALPIRHAVGDRAGLATLSNIGGVYRGLGQLPEALRYFEQALPIWHAVGNRAGERATRYNLAMAYRAQGQLAKAVETLQQVVALDAQGQHPDLAADRALLHQVEQEWRQS